MEIPNSSNQVANAVAFRDAYRANGYFFPLSLELTEEQRVTTTSLQRSIVNRLEQVIGAHPEQWMAFEPIWMETPGPRS